jgi:hypothetical protein
MLAPFIYLTGAIPSTSKECPATPGDLVFVQIEPRTSVEGYTLPESYLVDPTLSGEFWKCPFRPAVILSANKKKEGRYAFLLVPLTTSPLEGAISLKEIDISLPVSLSNMSAYVFPRAIEILCQVGLQIFFNAATLTRESDRHRCCHH